MAQRVFVVILQFQKPHRFDAAVTPDVDHREAGWRLWQQWHSLFSSNHRPPCLSHQPTWRPLWISFLVSELPVSWTPPIRGVHLSLSSFSKHLTRPWPSGDLIPDAVHPCHWERAFFVISAAYSSACCLLSVYIPTKFKWYSPFYFLFPPKKQHIAVPLHYFPPYSSGSCWSRHKAIDLLLNSYRIQTCGWWRDKDCSSRS